MPLFEMTCLNHHHTDQFVHVPEDYGTRTLICPVCLHTMTRTLSMGRGLCWFEEGRPRVIHNMGVEPVVVRSHEHHKRLMKERNLEWATRGRGMPGQWI